MTPETPRLYCRKTEKALEKPCCPAPDESCKHRSDCPVWFEMEDNSGEGCEKAAAPATGEKDK